MTSPTTTLPAARPKLPPVPAGAAGWSRTYVDAKGLPQKAEWPVPVDANGQITAHVRHACRGHIVVGQQKTPGGPLVEEKQPCPEVKWLLLGEKVPFCSDHGEQLRVDGKEVKAPVIPWEAIGKAAEPSFRPWWALLAEGVGAAAVQGGHVPWWALLPAAPVLAAGSYWQVRYYLTKRALKNREIEKGQRSGRHWRRIARRARIGAYTGAAAGAWLPAWAAVQPDTPEGVTVGAAGLLAWAVASATWWNYQAGLRHRPEPVAEPAADGPEVKAEPTPDELAARDAANTWDVEVAIAGTHLDPGTWQRIACGWQAVIVADKRGALNNLGGDNMKATIRRIAAAFNVPRSAVTWIEEHDDSPNRALLLIQPNNPLKDGQIWAGPDSITISESRIVGDVGALIDGNRMVETLFRFEEGMPSELVLGSTGSGKSERLRLSLVIQRWASYLDGEGQRRGLFLSFLHDPKRLNSYGEFRRAVHGYGITRDDAHIMIDAFLREMVRRYDMLRTAEWKDAKNRDRDGSVKFDPRIHGPLIKVIWDEFHELAGDKEFVAKLEKLARYQRACGMGSTIASHMGTLGDTGSQALRDMLAGGRASLLRTTSGLNATLATGGQLTGDPRALPKVPGMTLVADGEQATIMGRYSFIPDDRAADRMGERPLYDWLFDDSNEPIGYPAEIPAATAEAFGKEFMEWMEAGRKPGGRDVGPNPLASGRILAAGTDLGAVDALRQILQGASGPLRREHIVAHPLWSGRSATSTLTNALRAGQDAQPSWIVKNGQARATTFELSAAERERLEVEAAETADEQ